MKDYVTAAKIVLEKRRDGMQLVVNQLNMAITAAEKQLSEDDKPSLQEVTVFCKRV